LRKQRVRVKICGICSAEDALAAAQAGADALGFMFYERSSRYLTPEKAAEIISVLPPFISKTGVFVDADEKTIRRVLSGVPLDALQFHGNESHEFCSRFSLSVIKAFRMQDERSLTGLKAYQTAAWLLDSYVPGELGGTGQVFNWDLAKRAGEFGRPIILAGGLNPQNVAEAVHRVEPFAVDVSSGVETAPGRKDPALMLAFIQAVRSAWN